MPLLPLLPLLLGLQTPPTKPTTPPAKVDKKAEKKKVEKPREQKQPKPQQRPTVAMETTKGLVQLELEPTEAPVAVANFLALARRGYYDGLTFHRVEPELVQGGDPKGDGTGGPGYTIPFEMNRGLKNVTGVIGMARQANDKDSAGSQFYILKKDVPGFDANGYTLFGRVTAGMEVIEKIAVGDKMLHLTVTLPNNFTPRTFGPTQRAEPDSLFTPDLPADLSGRTYARQLRVRVAVSAQGTAQVSLVKGSGDEDIDDAVVLAIRHWKWQPALKSGQPVAEVQEFYYDLATNSRRYEGK